MDEFSWPMVFALMMAFWVLYVLGRILTELDAIKRLLTERLRSDE